MKAPPSLVPREAFHAQAAFLGISCHMVNLRSLVVGRSWTDLRSLLMVERVNKGGLIEERLESTAWLSRGRRPEPPVPPFDQCAAHERGIGA